jgi:gliding motility-associated lipoprotein GldD
MKFLSTITNPCLYFFSVVLLFAACNSEYTPRKRGYFKIEFPSKKYRLFDEPGYPYRFEYPVYARVIKDTTFFDTRPENDWWINIDFPQFNGKVFISYKEIGKKNKFDSLVSDAFKLSYKQHTYKATAIEPVPFTTPSGVEGIYFTLSGNTATANQFFVTDSVRNFLRGALYFDATPNEDSLSIVNDFLKKDLEHMINTFAWK